MGRHLVMARETARSQELLEAVRRLAEEDPAAEFVLLIPETPLHHLRMVTDGTAAALAEQAAEEARAHFAAAGVDLATARVADPNPVLAATTEVAQHPGYAGIVVSTFAPGVSRWLRMDVVSRLRRMTGLPVTHVTSSPDLPRAAEAP
jgi:hypothetical protein